MTTALIDADIVAYRCAVSAENDPLEIAVLRAMNMMDDIIQNTMATEWQGYISGANNFRYDIYPEYKANRKDTKRPRHLTDLQEYLINDWKCKVTDGIEADDALGIAQTENTIICSIDKDLRQIPGNHYNIVNKVHEYVNDTGALFNFYLQLVLGDRADNIMGYDGKARATVPKFLQFDVDELNGMHTEQAMFEKLHFMYTEAGNTDMKLTGQLLYIWRKENDSWNFDKLMAEYQQNQIDDLDNLMGNTNNLE